MSFLNPLALLALLSVPLLVLLYFLKLKRPQFRVPSTLLWQKVIEDMRVNSPFQKLRKSLLMLLQIIALLAAIFALARPLVLVRESVDESLIVLIDNSASMGAVEPGGRTRLDLAKKEAQRIADGLAKGDEMMLIAFNTRAHALCGFTNNRRMLKEHIDAVGTTECTTLLEPALLLAKSIANSRSKPRVILLSDGAISAPAQVEMPVDIEYQAIGTNLPNLAITGLDIRRSLSDRQQIEMFVATENFSTGPISGNMSVFLDDAMLDSKHFAVEAGETLSQIFQAILPAGGTVKVEFEAADALRCDNRAWRIIPPPIRKRVLIVAETPFFIERAFKASSSVECVSVTPSEYQPPAPGEYFAVIWNGVPAPDVAPCNNIYLGCFPKIEGLAAGAQLESPDVMDWDNTHPTARFLDFDNLIISSTKSMSLPESSTTILRSSQTPLIAALPTKYGTACITGFLPMKSNWPLLVSFPLFLHNCLEYFEQQQQKLTDANISVGQTITLGAAGDNPVMTLPSGEKRPLMKNAAGEYSFSDVNACGVYRVDSDGADSYAMAANLFDRSESSLTTTNSLTISGKSIQAVQVSKQVNREFWRYLVMALAAVLLLEWIVYHRRFFA